MALKSPLMPSPSGTGASPAFSPYASFPTSPAKYGGQHGTPPATRADQSNRSSGATDSLAPPSPYPSHLEPSPTDSNGTEGTDIEEDAQDDANATSPSLTSASDVLELLSPDIEITSPASAASDMPPRLDTRLPLEHRFGLNDDGPQSVIHIPSGFRNFEEARSQRQSPTQSSENTVVSPITPDVATLEPLENKRQSSVSPVNTDVPRYQDRSTPRAQTRQELEEDYKRKSRRTPSLEGLLPGFARYFEEYLTVSTDIPEGQDKDGDERNADAKKTSPAGSPATAAAVDGAVAQVSETPNQTESELAALRTALSECWTLCNTLAGLSSTHRTRTFKFTGRTEVQEQVWRSCWRLCQQLYEKRDEDHTSQVVPTLELCREFCQALFDARQKTDEATDSVLRVSFELNNHLYNTHDTKLPDAFNERTLDFYITLCHRLMKQRTSLPQETDSLLRACWSLAEMLFNIRQGMKEGKKPDEDSLGSAVQACWELCDLFREGWTQVRPDRGTPRPSQRGFASLPSNRSGQSNVSDARSSSSTRGSSKKYRNPLPLPPETPITIFDDASTAASSPESATAPNILVLGPASVGSNSVRAGAGGGGGGSGGGGGTTHHERWTSSASVLSDYSESATSQRSSSTATASGNVEERQLLRIRYLLLKAGMNTGYVRTGKEQLPAYVAALPDSAFGKLPWQVKVLSYYRKLVTHDASMQTAHTLPPRRLAAPEAAKAVRWLGSSEQWAWMRDLFRIVFGFGIEEADRRAATSFTI